MPQDLAPIVMDKGAISKFVGKILENAKGGNFNTNTALNEVARAVAGEKHNWGYLSGAQEAIFSPAFTGKLQITAINETVETPQKENPAKETGVSTTLERRVIEEAKFFLATIINENDNGAICYIFGTTLICKEALKEWLPAMEDRFANIADEEELATAIFQELEQADVSKLLQNSIDTHRKMLLETIQQIVVDDCLSSPVLVIDAFHRHSGRRRPQTPTPADIRIFAHRVLPTLFLESIMKPVCEPKTENLSIRGNLKEAVDITLHGHKTDRGYSSGKAKLESAISGFMWGDTYYMDKLKNGRFDRSQYQSESS